MVEQDAIYEEIQVHNRNGTGDYDDRSNIPNGDSSPREDDYNHKRHSIYEDMNGFGEELAEVYNIPNIHFRQSSDSALIVHKQPLYTSVKWHARKVSCSSEEDNNNNTSKTRQKKIYQRIKCRSAEDVTRFHPLNERETIYSEIVTNSQANEITTGRITRESLNPILQQNKMSRPSISEENRDIFSNGIYVDGIQHYGELMHKNKKQHKTVSLDRRLPNELYENSSLLSLNNIPSHEDDVYENSRPPTKFVTNDKNFDKNHLSQQDICSKCNQILFLHKGDIHENCDQVKVTQRAQYVHQELARSTESVISLYENVTEPEEIYENLSDHEWDPQRERSSSRPINITPYKSRTYDDSHVYHHHKKPVGPFSHSSMSSSVTSSPRGSICSSISSEQTRSMSPPPPLLSKRRQACVSSSSDLSGFQGLNYFPANYLGKQHVTKLTRDCIDDAVSYIAQRTNLLEMRPVVTEVSHELIRIGSNASPWDLIESFMIEEIVNFEVIVKNVPFIGIVAGSPGEEAFCYVLQTEKASEIADSIREMFQTGLKKKISKSRSLYDLQPDFHRFKSLVKVGSTKVRQSFRCVNEYIKLVLEKVNPKDFRNIDLEVLGSNVVIKDQHEEEISHSTPSILSLGVYSGDKRYFGYIITEVSTPAKQRVQCHVYRAARNSTAANIIDSISTSYQNAYSPRNSDNCDVNPIYSSTYGTKFNKSSPINHINPIYSKLPCTVGDERKTLNGEVSGRNSIVSISSTATSVGSLNFSLTSSIDSSPSSTKHRRDLTTGFASLSLIERLNSLRSNSNNNRLSMNVECISEEEKDLLIDFENKNEKDNLLMDLGSTDTLPTLTPSSPCSTETLPRSSPAITKRERPKSLPLLDLDVNADEKDYEKFNSSEENYARNTDQRKSKHKKLFTKFCGSLRGKLTPTIQNPPSQTPINGMNDSINNLNLIEKPIAFEDDITYATTHTFRLSYLCSSLVKSPLRPKHVRECYKQFAKGIHKADKVSHNTGLRTIGSPVELVIVTDTEVMMLDPKDPSNIIRQCSIELYEKCVQHPDENMHCFAFSTSIPGNHQHKIHLFTMPADLKSNIIQAFQQFEDNKLKMLRQNNLDQLI